MRGHAVLRIAEELQADRARVRGHAVHDPARAGDQAVAAFLLDAGQAGQELVGDVLAQALLAEGAAGDVQPLGALQRLAGGVVVLQLEARDLDVVDLAQVVVEPRDLQPVRVRRRPCATRPGCPARCPTARPSCRPRSSRCCRRCTRPRPRSGPRRTRSRAASAASDTRCVTTPASVQMVATSRSRPGRRCISTPRMASSFSVLITALFHTSGTAPPV